MTKSQIFFWLLLAFIAGVGSASFVPSSISVVAAVFVLSGCIVTFALREAMTRGRWLFIGFALMAFTFGLFWFLEASRPTMNAFTSRIGERVELVGVIDNEPIKSSQSQRFVVQTDAEKILIVMRPFPEYGYGDRLFISGHIERPENFSPDFDYVSYLARDGIFFTMRFPTITLSARGQGHPFSHFLFGLKAAFAANLERHLPEPHAAFMAGLLLGERQSFPSELTEKLRITGTSHIVALSGYNITIVADALLKSLMFFFVPFAVAFWLAACGIVGFALLTGGAASVVRAAIMGILVLVARREGRLYRMRNALAFAATVMLLENPKILRFDIGFQLSFVATLGLLYGVPILERGYEGVRLWLIPAGRAMGLIRENRDPVRARRRRSFLRDILMSTLAAQFAVLPFIVYRFGMLSLVAPIANVAILPVIPATMFFGFLTGGIPFLFDFLGRLAAGVSWFLLEYELTAIDVFSRLPGAAFVARGGTLAVLIAIYLLVGYRVWRANRHAAR